MAAAAPAPAAAPATGKRKRDLSEDDVYLILHKSVLLLALPVHQPPLPPNFTLGF
jgi:hypothetical protein